MRNIIAAQPIEETEPEPVLVLIIPEERLSSLPAVVYLAIQKCFGLYFKGRYYIT
jgi:hypothetical protein